MASPAPRSLLGRRPEGNLFELVSGMQILHSMSPAPAVGLVWPLILIRMFAPAGNDLIILVRRPQPHSAGGSGPGRYFESTKGALFKCGANLIAVLRAHRKWVDGMCASRQVFGSGRGSKSLIIFGRIRRRDNCHWPARR